MAVSSSNEARGLTLDGLSTQEASAAVIRWLQEKQLGAAQTNYKLRDWLFARQRYWGEPFPIMFEEGSEVSVVTATQCVLSLAWDKHQLLRGQYALLTILKFVCSAGTTSCARIESPADIARDRQF